MLDIENEFKFRRNDTIVIGCSTGPDSMALFHMLLSIREKYNLKLICAHVNHNVRKQSIQEEEYIKDFCQQKNVMFETMTITKYGDDNFENEARNIRYKFFKSLIFKYHANYLMTAHHGDDLVETILMRIARGSNLSGYSGFHKIVDMGDYKIVRPLIVFTKEELIEYDDLNKVKYYIDDTNGKMTLTRNRYRKYVLPFLKKENSNIHLKFLKFNRNLEEASLYIDKEREKAYKKIVDSTNKIDIDKFKELDAYIQKEILYYILENFYQDDLILLNDRHIQLLLNLINSRRSNMKVNLPNEIKAVKSYNKFYLQQDIDVLTEYEIEFSEYAELPNGHVIKLIDDTSLNSNDICRLNSEEISLPIVIRTRRLGDKIYVKGLNGKKKVKEIFIEKKIDLKDRDLWPIVTDSANNVIWIPGLKKSKFNKSKSEKCDIILKYC